MTSSAIKMEQLTYQRGHRYILQDINWEVKTGEHWAVLGENGSGKTSLLSIAAGFRQQTAGHVHLYGESFNSQYVLKLRQKIGLVSNSFFDNYFHNESVMRIILSGKCGTLGVDQTIDLDSVRQTKLLLKKLNILDKMDYSFSFLSKGEQQKVLIARALMAQPALYLLDEPMSGLDPINKKKTMDLVRGLSQIPNLTLCYVTHHIDEISPHIFKQCLLLKKGKVFAMDKTENLLTSEIMSDFFHYPVSIDRDRLGSYHMKVGE